MSKFVTYPAVTVLDNDHALLIDSPSAGTNSITADNAADTLLSKWSGFDTFDEAVQNTISNNQEFIDHDTAIRSETAELKRKIVTTFPAKEASGQIATFESEFEDAPLKSCIVQIEPVQDLHGYDSPWPGGGDKNLLNPERYIFNTTTINGVVYTVQADGTITAVGTSTAKSGPQLTNRFQLPAGTYSILQEQNSDVYAVFRGSDVETGGSTYSLGNPFTTDGTNWIYVNCWCNIDSGNVNAVIHPMLVSGSTAPTTFSPYSNICPITGWTGAKVTRTGKNLMQFTNGKGIDTNGRIHNIKNRSATVTPIMIVEGKRYKWYNTSEYACIYAVWNGDTLIRRLAGIPNGSILDTTDGKELYVCGYYSESINVLPEVCGVFFEDEFDGFVPYSGQTYPITFPTSAGTVYGGYVDVINGELVVDRAMVDLGTLWWAQTTSGGKRVFYTELYDAPRKATFYGICSKYKRKQSAPYENNTFILYGSNNFSRVGIRDDMHSESNSKTFKASLSGTQLVYELAEPIHYPITPTEIRSLLGQNNIWADTGDTAVEYLISDVSWYVEKKLRAFQSVLAGVEDSSTASKNYSTDSYLIFNDDIYRVTKTITAGETIEDGVNVTKTTVAEQLMALAQA